MRGNLIALLLAAVPSCLAQDGAVIRRGATTLEMPWVAGCPIGVDARQKPVSPHIYISTSQPAIHPVYSISLHSFDSRLIREASVKLVGSVGGRVMQVGEGRAANAETESFTLAKVSDVRVATKNLTAVRWIDLVSVTYADGTIWQSDSSNRCRVEPNGLLPVR